MAHRKEHDITSSTLQYHCLTSCNILPLTETQVLSSAAH